MKRLDDFGKVIKVVTELMDVTDQEILGKSRVPEVVDARWMVVALMHEKRYSTRQIAPLMLLSERAINNALNRFSHRAKYSGNNLGNILEIARKQLL